MIKQLVKIHTGTCYFVTCGFLAAGMLLTMASAASLGWGHIGEQEEKVTLANN